MPRDRGGIWEDGKPDRSIHIEDVLASDLAARGKDKRLQLLLVMHALTVEFDDDRGRTGHIFVVIGKPELSLQHIQHILACGEVIRCQRFV